MHLRIRNGGGIEWIGVAPTLIFDGYLVAIRSFQRENVGHLTPDFSESFLLINGENWIVEEGDHLYCKREIVCIRLASDIYAIRRSYAKISRDLIKRA